MKWEVVENVNEVANHVIRMELPIFLTKTTCEIKQKSMNIDEYRWISRWISINISMNISMNSSNSLVRKFPCRRHTDGSLKSIQWWILMRVNSMSLEPRRTTQKTIQSSISNLRNTWKQIRFQFLVSSNADKMSNLLLSLSVLLDIVGTTGMPIKIVDHKIQTCVCYGPKSSIITLARPVFVCLFWGGQLQCVRDQNRIFTILIDDW